MAASLKGVSLKSWPDIYLPPIGEVNFPVLKLKDSNRGLVEVATGKEFRLYVCGITPYDSTHLGHAATYLAFDLVNRYQRLSNRKVTFVENITDIDDPLLERAKRDNQEWSVLANSQIELFQSDMSALRIIPPEKFVKVTDSMELIESFIGKLEKNGYLYQVDGDFYFSCADFLSALPQSLNDSIRIFAERGGDPTRESKKHPLDPLVWSANVIGEPGWQSKYGYGRPGWHVECTAIACEYLDNEGTNPVIDIQGGGSDLIFPHHFMSAQIVKAALGRDFSDNYIHAAMIAFDGEKMSKSKGNLVFVSSLIKQGIDPMVIRWALLSGHFQQNREWNSKLLETAQSEVSLVRSSLARSEVFHAGSLVNDLITAISNNLDTPTALKLLVEWAKASHVNPSSNDAGLVSRAIDSLLGLAL
jgi:L-cysteine:1D-myo-inositol 2-amino-2-deoxy-alpha-D-glucopyranoside ligase